MKHFHAGGEFPSASLRPNEDDLVRGRVSLVASSLLRAEQARTSTGNAAIAVPPHSESLTPQSIDAMLARELNQLTFQEREGIFEEFHGVHNSAVDETPDFVERKLAALEREIQSIPHKPAYDRAVRLNSAYVRDEQGFRLPFLRAEHFQEQQAANRMMRYLAFVQELYGQVALVRPTYLSDLTALDLAVLRAGNWQLLPGRDKSVRRIIGLFGDIPPEFPVVSRVCSAAA
jgi:hypothetical protein